MATFDTNDFDLYEAIRTHEARIASQRDEAEGMRAALREQVASLTAAIEDTLDRIWRNPRLGRRWSCRLCNDRSFDTGPHHGECELWPLIEAVARIKSVEADGTGVQA